VNNKNYGKKILAFALTAALATTTFVSVTSAYNDDTEIDSSSYALASTIQDGTILHCFDWKYSDIIAELPNIAKAGFTSVQTSPAQPSEGQGAWSWLYQPLGFSVQQNGLGTMEDLKELCDAAEKYGINVIVDVVANHLADNHENIQEDLKDEKYWHSYGDVKSDANREMVINGDIGMTDLATVDEYVQSVIMDYVQELKEAGVDGIRWDAAKHIGLPSEGSAFWKKVSDNGIYNYGEILNTPGGSDPVSLLEEYTSYIAITDNGYGNGVLSSFRGGKAPKVDGNWTNKGIPAYSLVYWGESHDTYSNGEGKDSNGATQNEVDRAYAVVAARNYATSLYLSRPFAKARDSIRIGDKGSMHFTSPEVAAVNHFHNAMVDKEDYYTVSDNCAVVTRKDGGAVIVMGSGNGGEVSVENGGGYAKPGVYKDEITGNEFVVTEDTITGTVGESGIAVVYESKFASRLESSVETGTTFKGETLKVTLKVIGDFNDLVYNTSEGLTGNFEDGQEIEIGKEREQGGEVVLTLSGTDSDGNEFSSVYVYTKAYDKNYPSLEVGGVVFDNTKTNWKKINIYVYDEITVKGETITNGSWPGVAMEECGENLYKYILPDQFAPCKNIMVIFNNGSGDQIPAAMAAGMTMAYTDKKLYDGTNWTDLPNSGDEPSEESSEPVQESSEPSVDSEEPSEDSEQSVEEPVSEVSEESSDESSDEEPSEDEPSVNEPSVEEPSDDEPIYEPSVKEPSNNQSGGNNNGGNDEPQIVSPDGNNGTVATSDNTPLAALFMLLAASAVVGGVAVARKRKSE